MASPTGGVAGSNRKRFEGADAVGRETGVEHVVLGGGHVGAAIARRLQADDHRVSLVDETHDPEELPGFRGRPDDLRALEAVGVSDATRVVVASSRDSQNLLVAQLVRAHFDVPEVVVLVNVPERCGPVAEAGHLPVCATTALSETVVGRLARPEVDGDATP